VSNPVATVTEYPARKYTAIVLILPKLVAGARMRRWQIGAIQTAPPWICRSYR
jgi:hypothetical protein